MSIKRIIELDEIEINGQKFYKALGCNTLIFDENGFEKITKPLEGSEKRKPLNCRFVVTETKTPKNFTVGKVYEVINGRFSLESGSFPICEKVYSEDELIEYLGGEKFGMSHFNVALPTKILIIKEDN